jgi:hypothetical protein
VSPPRLTKAYVRPLDDPGGIDDPLGGLDVALVAEVQKSRPAGGDDAPGPRAIDRRGSVDAAGPVGRDGELVMPVLLVPVEDDRGALRGVAVLVGVRADAAHALEPEVELGDAVAGRAHEADEEAAEAGVHVHGDVVTQPELRDRFDVVHCAVGEVRGRADQLRPIRSINGERFSDRVRSPDMHWGPS